MITSIGFYGQSNCAYLGENSYLTKVANEFQAKIVNTGVRQGSEERILIELKKTKKIDVAVIFHAEPSYLYLPNSDRDFDTKGLIGKRADYIWSATELSKIGDNWEYHKQHHKKFIEKFNSPEIFKEVISNYKDYLYDQDLVMNRYYGSIIQIDQYLTAKNIPSIHVVNEKNLPTWFDFKNIKNDNTLSDIFNQYPSTDRKEYINGLNIEGNLEASKYLINTIAARSRQGHTLDNQSREGGSNPPAAPTL